MCISFIHVALCAASFNRQGCLVSASQGVSTAMSTATLQAPTFSAALCIQWKSPNTKSSDSLRLTFQYIEKEIRAKDTRL